MKGVLNFLYNFNDFVLGICTIVPAFLQFIALIPDFNNFKYKKSMHKIKNIDIVGIIVKVTCCIVLLAVGFCSIIKNISTVIPLVEGMPLDNAIQTLNEAGIKFSSDIGSNNPKDYKVKNQSKDHGNLIWNWETLTLTTEKYRPPEEDGILKLSFYNGRFSYHSSQEDIFYSGNDIIEQSNCAYFADPILPTVYITIIDSNGDIYDKKSEHTKECTIPLKYGDYSIQVSGDGYKKYCVDVSLRPDNKISNVWNHDVYLIPDQFVVHDLKIQVIDSNHIVCSSQEVSIGYSGYSLYCETDENGYIKYLFTLSKGDYHVGLENGQRTWFSINEANIDNGEITVFLTE